MILSVKDFYVSTGAVDLIKGVDLEVKENESIGILGLSGAGKSVTFRSILGLDRHFQRRGQIIYRDKVIEKCLRHELKDEIGYITQDVQNSLNPYISIIDQMVTDLVFVHKMNKDQARKIATESLEDLGIGKEEQGKYPDEFSGGMKQRVVISMILNRNPKLLIADEISASLDRESADLAIELLEKNKRDKLMSLVYISHNPYDAIRLCDRIYVFKDGKIIENKKSEEIFDSQVPQVQDLLEAARIIYGQDTRN